MATTYRTCVSKGWSDMGRPFRTTTTDGIIGCPSYAPYQCGYDSRNPVCVSDPSLCPIKKGLPAGPGDGFSLVPVAHPNGNSSFGWCGGKTNKHLPASQTWNQSCRSTYHDVYSIVDGVYGDGLPFLTLSSPIPTVDACHTKLFAKVSSTNSIDSIKRRHQ